ncbi:hypothetical protein BH10PSE17_BH10PSE17_25550 [soil metagenome]
MHKIVVPSLNADVREVRVLEWHCQPGDHFDAGELIVELETHKVVIEVRAVKAGWLRAILAEAGAWAGLDGPIALVSDDAEEPLTQDLGQATTFAVDFTLD